ncbi:MAG: hypothetical protein ACRDAJ_06885 [Serratia fonticola]
MSSNNASFCATVCNYASSVDVVAALRADAWDVMHADDRCVRAIKHAARLTRRVHTMVLNRVTRSLRAHDVVLYSLRLTGAQS